MKKILPALAALALLFACTPVDDNSGTESAEVPAGAVDLGLSVYWATCNIGANAPEEYGGYYDWGETETKEKFTSNYKWFNYADDTYTKYNTSSSYGAVDNKTVLEPEDDVAHVKLGGSWRMPTDAEWTELRDNCTWTWTAQNGVNGSLVTGPNGNSIFLPAAGCAFGTAHDREGTNGFYWSSSLDTDDPSRAWAVNANSKDVRRSNDSRNIAYPVRPVCE